MITPVQKEIVDRLTEQLTDDGKIIEAGWVALRKICLPEDCPESQLTEMRFAFLAGAQHLFASIITMLSPEAEPTEQDMRRMTLIYQELEVFKMSLQSDHKPGHS